MGMMRVRLASLSAALLCYVTDYACGNQIGNVLARGLGGCESVLCQ